MKRFEIQQRMNELILVSVFFACIYMYVTLRNEMMVNRIQIPVVGYINAMRIYGVEKFMVEKWFVQLRSRFAMYLFHNNLFVSAKRKGKRES